MLAPGDSMGGRVSKSEEVTTKARVKKMSMFCYQCEQTAKGTGCNWSGICGKDPDTAALQDLLVNVSKGISNFAHRARELGQSDSAINVFTLRALFTTVTNVNFDPKRIEELLREAAEIRDKAKTLYEQSAQARGVPLQKLNGYTSWIPGSTLTELIRQGESYNIEKRREALNADIVGLQELLTYGLKGMAAYAYHAYLLGYEDEAIYSFLHEALDALTYSNPSVKELLQLNLRCGEVNLRVMKLLDQANTESYGHPVPTKVRVEPLKGKAILVSGHDLKDLQMLLEQSKDSGVNVYTHGEMLPAHSYPKLKAYPHLVGNYGGAWQDQRAEFEAFPGAILMTTNCIQQPKESYQQRIFTSGLVAWPGVQHIKGHDFTPLINAALAAPGFSADGPAKEILVGFGHNTVLSVAPKVIEALKSGALKRFFLIGGCDGAKPGRNYYTDFALALPKDCVILTLACGKYRFNKLNFGDIGGIPRLLDCGQCNDAYGAIKIAGALAEAFNCGINDLPLSFILSWYEQKAICILLTLLHLGIKNMRLGPTLPAFVTPAVLKVLVEKFQIKPITTVERDLEAALAGA